MGQLSHCCCCISLRTGALIIGLLYLIGSSIYFAGLVLAIYKIFDPRLEEWNDFGDGYNFLYALRGFNEPNKVIAIYMLALCILQIIVDVVLIVGAAQRKAAFVVPWLVLNIVLLVFNLLGLMAVSIIGFVCMPSFINVVSITPLVVAFLYLAVSTYFMMIVTSFYEIARKSF